MVVPVVESPVSPRSAPRSAPRSGGPTAAAFAFVAATLLVPIARSGLWDPFELKSIELARRIALGLFGAAGLSLAGAENALPSRGEVDRGELPFTSMALGLRLFGLHVWAGRLPLALFALGGLVATYALVRRLVDRSAAIWSVLVLGTMPLFYLHARTMLGDAVTMAAFAGATAGLALSLFDGGGARCRVAWLLVAGVALVVGLLSRGLLLGVSVPLLGASLAWLVSRLSGLAPRQRSTDVLGGVLLLLGVAALSLGTLLFVRAAEQPDRYFTWLGFGITRAVSRPTFDAVIGMLGHALFPWSALVPVALSRVAHLPPALSDDARLREGGLRLTLVLTAALGLGAWGAIAPDAGVLPFGPVASLAVLVALCLRDIDRGAPPTRAGAMLGIALVVLLLADFVNLPDKALSAFAVEGARYPDTLRAAGLPWLFAGTALAVLGLLAALLEEPVSSAPAFDRRDYAAWLLTVRDLWNGNLLFGACVLEAALLGFAGFDLLGTRVPALARFAVSSEGARAGLRLAWLVLPLLFALPLVVLALRDGVRVLMRARSRSGWHGFLPSRAGLAGLGFLACGTGMSLGFYPALAAQLSPQGTFDAFKQLSRPGEELALVGTSSASAPYAAGRSVVSLAGLEQAYEWLMGATERRWLVLRADNLNGLNSRYRARSGKHENLPILDGRSSEILLASNRLLPGEKSQNPLDRYLLSRPPRPTRPLDANLGDQLDVLGWDVTDLDLEPVRAIKPGRRYEFVAYYRVVARVTGTWETFVHIDGFQRRFNADHPTLEGRYPFALWNVDDIIADRYQFALEPNFTRGAYRVYLGLYSGSKRLAVRRGEASDDRLEAGEILVE